VTGCIPESKDPRQVGQKLIQKYEIDVSESTRARRKQKGLANLQYLRHERFFVLLATKGRHRFFEEEGASVRDFRRQPLRFAGYSISYRRGGRTRKGGRDPQRHAHVEIARERFLELKAHFSELATRQSSHELALAFYHLPFEPYAPVRRQYLRLWQTVNKARHAAGFGRLPVEVVPLRRRVVKPFRERELHSDRELAAVRLAMTAQERAANRADLAAGEGDIGHGQANHPSCVCGDGDALGQEDGTHFIWWPAPQGGADRLDQEDAGTEFFSRPQRNPTGVGEGLA
jgi:hypothetical protein